MADLDFTHHVSEIPAGASLPKPYQRTVGAEVSPVPDIQSAASQFAANTNWMSALGGEVASKASNAIASRIGGELGKNPHGELGPSFTEFDKTMNETYATQAAATLGLQAQKLITQSNLELAAAPRLSAGMIAKSQAQVSYGLERIYSLAPDSIRPHLEQQYGSVMLQQNETLTRRMIGEQKQDFRNNTEVSNKINNQNAHSLTLNDNKLDKNGDSKAGLDAVRSVERINDAALAARVITPEEARVAKQSAKISYLSGKYTRQALEADKNGKLPELYRSWAEKPPKDVPDEFHFPVLNNVAQYMNEQASLKLQDQQLKMAQFNVKLAENPDQAALDFVQLQSELNPLQGQQAKLALINALNKNQTDNQATNLLASDWGNSELLARSDTKHINKAFDTLVSKAMQTANQAGGAPLSHDDAEVMVAGSAGGNIPVFTKSLHNKLSSGNPQMMESAAQQMHLAYERGEGHALSGLDEKDLVAFNTIEALRNSVNPTEAMTETINKIYNQDPQVLQTVKAQWQNYIVTLSKSTTPINFAISTFAGGKDFITVSNGQAYGADILSKYQTNYILANGDEAVAKATTQRWVDENYGDTWINGKRNYTMHPIEKLLGYEGSDIVPTIHKDVMNQLNDHFAPIKEAFSRGETNEYWESEPLSTKTHGIFSTTYEPIKVSRFTRQGETIKKETFDIVLSGNSFDKWDIAVNANGIMRPLYQVAPYLGLMEYNPNRKWINEEYLGKYHAFPEQRISNILKPFITPGETNE